MSSKTKRILQILLLYVLIVIGLAIAYYVTLPAINLAASEFYTALTVALAALLLPVGLIRPAQSANFKPIGNSIPNIKLNKPMLLVVIAPIVILLCLQVFSSTFFHAKAYASVIDVTESVFEEDLPQADLVSNIALMDTATAQIVGNRTLGSLSHVVSQYEISYTYNQINFCRTPQKVANLEYAGFFKWIGNRARGIPGFVMVDPVNNSAEYKELTEPMRYVESGYFGDDLFRALRFSYPTKILGTPRFEVDDEMNPVFVVPCYAPKVLPIGALDVNEVILFDPIDGSSEIYALDETPAWIDIVFDGYLASEKYNWKGTLSGGFWNSIIGNKDCKQTTDDFGYIVIEDDVWYYTGVTSVNSDKSNIAFILTNARTGEYKYYPVIGAEEHSAMNAAEGEVQEKNYTASFPALINVLGEPTYIMVLKDYGGLVKLYALVNVRQYSIVATGTTQEKAMEEYRTLLVENEIVTPEDLPTPPSQETVEHEITITDIRIVDIGGGDAIYLGAERDGKYVLYTAPLSGDESLLLIRAGDVIRARVPASAPEIEGIYTILEWARA